MLEQDRLRKEIDKIKKENIAKYEKIKKDNNTENEAVLKAHAL